jgi:2-phosphoglycerate kinase
MTETKDSQGVLEYRETFSIPVAVDRASAATAVIEEAAAAESVRLVQVRGVQRRRRSRLEITAEGTSRNLNCLRARLGQESPLWVLLEYDPGGSSSLVGSAVAAGLRASSEYAHRGWWELARRRRDPIAGDPPSDPSTESPTTL